MSTSLPLNQWLSVLQSEYLDGFLNEGGAAVKFAVALDGVTPDAAHEAVRRIAESKQYVVAHADAATTKIHLIEQLFFQVSTEVPWERLCEGVVLRVAQDWGYRTGEDDVTPLSARLARANELDADVVVMELRKKLTAKVFKNRHLAKDFRIAMFQLCLASITGGEEGVETSRVLLDWLTGRNRLIAPVKHYHIFVRITRANARHFFASLFEWVRLAGFQGTVLTLDISRLLASRAGRSDSLFYSKAAVLDAYEVLRQFIDSTDRLSGLLLVVTSDAGLLKEDDGRAIGAYPALKNRVFDEIRDRHMANPMSSLVRLSDSESR